MLRADWPQEETEQGANGGNVHLWEESWDDDDASEDFSKQLRYVFEIRATYIDIHYCDSANIPLSLHRTEKS